MLANTKPGRHKEKEKAVKQYLSSSACKWYTQLSEQYFGNCTLRSMEVLKDKVHNAQTFQSQTFTRAERTTGRKVTKSALQFVWVYHRHFARGLHFQITFCLWSLNMRVRGCEKFSWPVTFPVQRKFSQEVLREGKRKGPSEEDWDYGALWTLDALLTQSVLFTEFCIYV